MSFQTNMDWWGQIKRKCCLSYFSDRGHSNVFLKDKNLEWLLSNIPQSEIHFSRTAVRSDCHHFRVHSKHRNYVSPVSCYLGLFVGIWTSECQQWQRLSLECQRGSEMTISRTQARVRPLEPCCVTAWSPVIQITLIKNPNMLMQLSCC